MVKPVETLRDIPFDEPRGSLPSLDLRQSGMTPMRRPKAMRESTELRLVVRLQDGAHHFLQQLVRPRRESQRGLCRGGLLRDVDPPDRRSPPAALSQGP